MAESEVHAAGLLVKTCKHCRQEKPVTEFYIRAESGKPRAECKACYRDAMTRRRDPEDNRRRVREWIKANPERHRAHGRRTYKRKRSVLETSFEPTLRSKRAACRKAKVPFKLRIDDIIGLYRAQDGRCALTGRQMVWGGKGVQRDTVSIDRIERTLGYVPGNVRLLTFQANFARNQFTDEDLFEFCRAVLEWRDGK